MAGGGVVKHILLASFKEEASRWPAAGGPEEATEEEDMRGYEGCARWWPKSGISWGYAWPRRWRREPRLFNEGYGFGCRGTPGDCASWKRLLSCQLSYFNFGLTIIVRVPLSSIFYLL
ncbi:hypothetical protein ZEAMMB73_Zm00001d002587 [Zea mays]|uniref:Uncharacterized protein n=1 Tax=Zea mays TaxID=4577 RepID=A0A1D6E230_MAIZE|nr:hypothetical protein ZEAMMB73_Zm00001d002587 [Zea mays]